MKVLDLDRILSISFRVKTFVPKCYPEGFLQISRYQRAYIKVLEEGVVALTPLLMVMKKESYSGKNMGSIVEDLFQNDSSLYVLYWIGLNQLMALSHRDGKLRGHRYAPPKNSELKLSNKIEIFSE